MSDRAAILKELRTIPNIGKSMADDLYLLGIRAVVDLAMESPDNLYDRLSALTKTRQDPCVWDTFASAVHFAKTGERRSWWTFTEERKEHFHQSGRDRLKRVDPSR